MRPELVEGLKRAVPGGVTTRLSDRLAMAHDASHYLLTPEAVVTPRTPDGGRRAVPGRV